MAIIKDFFLLLYTVRLKKMNILSKFSSPIMMILFS